MGSPVSVVIANLVMENIENRALPSFPSPPVFWKRYVDVCCAIKRDVIAPLLQHINSVHPSIQFTHEVKDSEHHLFFLNILLKQEDDGAISMSVYRKPTHTDRYLDFRSHHPLVDKAAVVRTLFSRAACITSCAKRLEEEHNHIFRALQTNGYPKKFVEKSSHV